MISISDLETPKPRRARIMMRIPSTVSRWSTWPKSLAMMHRSAPMALMVSTVSKGSATGWGEVGGRGGPGPAPPRPAQLAGRREGGAPAHLSVGVLDPLPHGRGVRPVARPDSPDHLEPLVP